jgi:hypothetical protein
MYFLLHSKHIPCKKKYLLKQHSNPRAKAIARKCGSASKKYQWHRKYYLLPRIKFFNSVKNS